MIVSFHPPPLDPIFRHRVTTPAARLASLTTAARQALRDGELSFPALAAEIGATRAETRDVVQHLGRDVALFCAGRGWHVRLRSPQELRLVAANDNQPRASVLEAGAG